MKRILVIRKRATPIADHAMGRVEAWASPHGIEVLDGDDPGVGEYSSIDADLVVAVTSDNSNPIIPDTITVTATISNGGPDDASSGAKASTGFL